MSRHESGKTPQELVQQSNKNAAQQIRQTPQQKLALLLVQLPQDRDEMLQHMLQYAQTDLLCYRMPIEAHGMQDRDLPWNEKLRARQDAAFDPMLDWAAQHYGIVLHSTEGVMPIAQPDDSLHKIAALFSAARDREVVALAMLVPIFGSVILALAVWKNFCSIEDALIAARLDETVQAERYGVDAETDAKWALKCADARAAANAILSFPS